ncbi:X-linked retinitis pigmentosa GTPase regulator isoform X2 [Etheostoma spectabile]|uniref:X-linked retinitis pigmentosa GTPase regulator isoform X2 n=1 Tax=Etheostoma spectabile TaxID=54343 RepID=UPI0013AEC221|nr:X-linked retinitis pigmentosa GTPase regulator-like isoform X2 [Etheostoma spectabile]
MINQYTCLVEESTLLSSQNQMILMSAENGRLLMFGGNTWGQLGLGFKPVTSKPASVKSLKSENVKHVACGRDHTIVCTRQGSVFVAGSNQEGQLGLGHCNNTTSFHLLHPFCDRAPIKMLSAGCNTSAALTEDGRLFMWGDNAVGQIGLGDEEFAAEPREVDVREAVIWVSCGYHHSAFVTVDGDLYTFGESGNGRLGLQVEQLGNHRVPQQVQGILGRVTQVCCGGEHTVALTEENVYTFGRGQYGQLGHGTFLFEVDLPKPLEHFCNSSIKHIACGENHTAVITKSGFLYTFGDGRHGKLGLGEENFINQFSPTLCTRFVKYNVQLVSCGGNHMLVLATPRPPESQEVVPGEDVTITENVLEPIYTEIILLDPLIDPNPLVPLSAFSARARHREKGSSVELFGKTFQNLPRLNSGFLNISWQTSRNIPKSPKMLSKDFTTPSSSPKPQSEATLSPPLSPRSPVLPSEPTSPRSQSSNTFQNKSSKSKSKSKELHPPLLSPKCITKHNTPVSPKRTPKKRLNKTTEKAFIEESPLSPKEPCSPTRPSSDSSKKHLSEEEHPVSPQTERETTQSQFVIEELEEKGVDSDFLPNVEKKKGRALRKTTKEAELFAKRLQFNGKAEQNPLKASPTGLLKGSLKKEVYPLKSLKSLKNTSKKVTSEGKENITVQSNKIKAHEDGIARKETSHLESPKLLASSPKTPKSFRKTLTQQRLAAAVKENDIRNRNVKESIINQEDMKASALKKNFISTLKKDEKKSSALVKTSSVMKVTTGNETTSISVQRGSSLSVEKDAEIESETIDVKPVEVQRQRDSQQFISTPTKDFHKVESALGRGQNKKKDTTPAFIPAQVDSKKSRSVKSIPGKVKGKPNEIQSTLVKNPSKGAGNTPVKSESKVKVVGSQLKKAKKVKGRTTDKQKIPEGDSAEVKGHKKAKEYKLKEPGGGEGDEIRVKGEADSEDITRAEPRSKQTEVSTPIEVLCNPISSQSTQRTEVIPVSGAKSPQGPKPVDSDPLVSGTHREDAQSLTEEKPIWGEILSTAASLLPVVGIAGTALKGLSDAVTNIGGLQSDSDTVTSTPPKTPSRVKQFTKQSAVMQPSFSSTLSHFSSTEASNPEEQRTEKDVQVTKNVVQEEERNDTLQSQQGLVKSDGNEDTSQQEHKEDKKTYKDHKGGETDTEDEETKKNKESGSHVEGREEDEEEGSESSDDLEEEKDSVSVDGEEEKDNELAEEDGEEEDGSAKSDVTEAEEEEEESSEETGGGGSESEESEASEEEGSESEEENEESEVSEDEEDESSQESGSSRSKESEEDRDEGDTAESDSEEEESEVDAEEEGEMEEEKDSTEKDSEEDEETDESEGEEDEEQDEVSVENEEEEDSELDEDEEELDEMSDKENEEDEEEEQEGEEEEESMEEVGEEEEEESKEDEEEEDKEESKEEVGEEEEEASKEEEGEEEEEEGDEKEVEEDTKITEEEKKKKKKKKGEEDVAEEEGEEEEEREVEKEKKIMRKEKSIVATEKEMEETDDEEEEEEGIGEEEENETKIKPKIEGRLKNQREETKQKQPKGKKSSKSEENEDEESKAEVNKVGKEEEEEEEEEEEGLEKEEGEEEEKEEGDEEEEEEEEVEEKVKSSKTKNIQKLPPDRKDRQQKEAPKPAPRTKQRAGVKKQDDSQQFWNNVLPQYLDLQ